MKKLLLGILLLAALVAIIYLKSVRDSERQGKAFRKGHQAGVMFSQKGQAALDSLSDLLNQERTHLTDYRAALADSLAERDLLYAQTVDSLVTRIESLQSEIAQVEKKALADNSASGDGERLRKDTSGKASHTSILNHYRLAMSKLPADLSAYEQRVAVNEVRAETATRFSITLKRLEEIRGIYKLDY